MQGELEAIAAGHVKAACCCTVLCMPSIVQLPVRYKSEIRVEDKHALRQLIKEQYHYQVTPEIHREFDASR